MPTEMINIKLDSKFLREIDEIVENENYHSRTEYIRELLRKDMENKQFKKLVAYYESLRKKFGKKNISDEEYERNREDAFLDMIKKHQARSSGK